MNRIIKDAIIIYKNGSKEVFSAVSIDKNGVYPGHIITNSKGKQNTFIEHGFIPKDHIKKIYRSCEEKQHLEIDLIEEEKEEKKK